MRVALTSDLHVEHHPEVIPLAAARVRALAPDVLVVAGDVSHDLVTLESALAALKRAAPRLVFVPGNHDLWCGRAGAPSSRERYERVIPAACARAGCDTPIAAPVTIDGVVFVGVTGWYDYSLRNRALDGKVSHDDYERGALGRLRWNDKAHVVWPGDDGRLLDDPAICAAQVQLLERQLADAGARPTVAVTHHLPFFELVTSKNELPWDFINAFMGSARLGEALLAARNLKLACCGHTHFRKRALVGAAGAQFAVEVSPVGYPREYARHEGLTLAERVAERVIAIDLAS
jgi:3',5'-cyclic AMP phosphodiesterase CpdA